MNTLNSYFVRVEHNNSSLQDAKIINCTTFYNSFRINCCIVYNKKIFPQILACKQWTVMLSSIACNTLLYNLQHIEFMCFISKLEGFTNSISEIWTLINHEIYQQNRKFPTPAQLLFDVIVTYWHIQKKWTLKLFWNLDIR